METIFEIWAHPITIGLLLAAALVGPLVLRDQLQHLRRREEQFELWFGQPLSSVLSAPTRQEGVERMRKLLERSR